MIFYFISSQSLLLNKHLDGRHSNIFMIFYWLMELKHNRTKKAENRIMMSFYSLCFAFKLDSISFEERRLWTIRNLYARHFLCGSEHRIVLCSCLPSLQTKKLQWLHRGRPLIKFYYVMQKQQDFIKLDLFHLKDGVLRRKTQILNFMYTTKVFQDEKGPWTLLSSKE